MTRFLLSVAIVTALTVNIAVFTGLYWAFADTSEPAVLIDGPDVSDTRLSPGESTEISYELLQLRNCPGWMYQVVTGERAYPMDASRFYQEKGTRKTITNTLKIPRDASPGLYTYLTLIDYSCNPLRTLTFVTPPVHLEVISQ